MIIYYKRMASIFCLLGIWSALLLACGPGSQVSQDGGEAETNRDLVPCEEGQHNGGDDYCYPLSECAEGFSLEESGVCSRWVTTQPLLPGRWLHEMISLDNRYAMICGGRSGDSVLDDTALFDQNQDTWVAVSSLPEGRYGHALVNIGQNQIMMAGGYGQDESLLTSTAFFRGDIGDWVEIAHLNTARTQIGIEYTAEHGVFVFGGIIEGGATTNRIEQYHNEEWAELESQLLTPRSSMETVRLGDGRILIVGGLGQFGETKSSAEIFDPVTQVSEFTGSMVDSRSDFSAAALDETRVLVTGGYVLLGDGKSPLRTAEIFDSATGTWTDTGFMRTPRYGHQMVALGSGLLVVIGGFSDDLTPLKSAEIYDPDQGAFREAAPMQDARGYFGAAALTDGRILASHGKASMTDDSLVTTAEVYEPGE